MKATAATPAKPPLTDPPDMALADRYPLFSAIFMECRRDMLLSAAGLAFIFYTIIYVTSLVTAKDFLTIQNAIIGGDFVVFWTAAKSIFTDHLAAIYHPGVLSVLLDDAFPARGGFNLTWQYPPTMFFLILPLGVLPYLSAHWIWGFATAGMLAAVIRGFWRNNAALIIAFTSAAAYQGFITGQTGFLTAALIAAAAGWADRRPMIAGLAAGLLTVKPQLGLLIPFAFAAAGCWRAFTIAALTGAALAGLSIVAFGGDVWIAFYEAVTAHGERLGTDIFPYHKLISPFGGLMVLGAPAAAAMAVQGIITMSLAAFVFIIWRRVPAWDLRLIALCSAAALASPYAFYYELPILIPPLLLVARRGMESGWLRGEKHGLMVLWIAPLLLPGNQSLPFASAIAIGAFAIGARRAMTELTRSATSPAPAI